MAASPVLDSYALLAFLRGEHGDDQVAALLERAGEKDQSLHMTEANYAEVKYITIRKNGVARWSQIAPDLRALPIEFHPIDRTLADLAADIKAHYKISLADAFAAALAKEQGAELVTGDLEFTPLEKEIRIVWLT